MKELSIEEKAKAYDKALEKARQLCAYPTTKPFISDLQDLFPELKDSEDERIRGKILATIHLYYGEPLEDEAKEMVAWLEKRGQTFTKKDIDDAYLKGICDAKHELEKQGEQKPAWSEEDDIFFRALIRDIENIPYISEDAKKDRKNWLKSLRPQNHWKPTAEQMRVLEWCKPLFAEPESKAILESLIDDLKKLKG